MAAVCSWLNLEAMTHGQHFEAESMNKWRYSVEDKSLKSQVQVEPQVFSISIMNVSVSVNKNMTE